ncbi:MAG: hypothetical protein ACLUI3_05420 [Christensenellales bacterium]
METVRRALMAELTEQVRHNPELLGQLESQPDGGGKGGGSQ